MKLHSEKTKRLFIQSKGSRVKPLANMYSIFVDTKYFYLLLDIFDYKIYKFLLKMIAVLYATKITAMFNYFLVIMTVSVINVPLFLNTVHFADLKLRID